MTQTPPLRPDAPPPFAAHRSILASAGSGKTFQLTNRYVRLLYDGADPGTILASTFTRLAAGEIRDRIMQRLATAAVDADARGMLAEHVHPGMDQRAVMRLLESIVRNLHRVQIRTLDSFFAAIVQSFALELGLPAGPGEARVVDEDEDQALRLEAIRLMLDESDPQSLVNLLRAISEGSVGRSVTDAIDSEVRQLYELYRESSAEAWQTITAPKPLPRAQLESAVELIAQLTSDEKRVRTALADDVARLRTAIGHVELDSWFAVLTKGLPNAIATKNATYFRKPLEPAIVAAYEPIIEHGTCILRMHVAHRTRATHELVERFHRQYEVVKQQQRALTFSDLTARVVAMPMLEAFEELYFRLDSRVDHMLLDEMQDTSILQWRGLEPLVREIVSHAPMTGTEAGGPPRSFFAVGDVKQSIYGWRGACPEVLEHLPQLLSGVDGRSPVTVETLPRSYRSAPSVIEAVNQLFTNVRSSPALTKWARAAAQWDDAFVTHDTALTDLTGYAELRTVARVGDDDAADDDADASQKTVRLREAVDLIADLHARAPDQSIGVLVRKNDVADRLLYMLGPAGMNLPATGPGGGSLADAPAVGAILDLLTLSDHPDHTVAAFNVAHGPLGAVVDLTPDAHDKDQRSARMRVSQAVRRSLQRDGYLTTIRRWVEQILPQTDRRQARRLAQLLDYTASYEPRATLRAVDFVRSVEHARIRTGERSPIEVMTYHQAKGLQFASVILPDLNQDLVRTTGMRAVYEREGHAGPISRICATVKQDAWPLLPDLEPIFDTHINRMAREALCLLYVAVTRAERGLYMLIDPAKANERTIPKQFAGVLRTMLGDDSADPSTVLYQHGDPNWIDSVERDNDAADADEPADDHTIVAPIQLRSVPDRRRAGDPAAPSAHADDDGRFDLHLHDRDARDRGTAIHALFEQITWLDPTVPSDDALITVVQRVLPRRHRSWIADHVESFRAMCARPAVAALLDPGDRPVDRTDVQRERSFARLVDGQPQIGVIDRLEIERDAAGQPVAARIIDWKTDRIAPDQAAAAGTAGAAGAAAAAGGAGGAGMAERYRAQLSTYAHAVSAIYGLGPDRIDAMLCFVETGDVVPVDLADAADAADEINSDDAEPSAG